MNPEQINEIIGTEGDDTLTGTQDNDSIIGNTGNDEKTGDAGDDRFIWNNGDGSDINEGDDGLDIAEINGAPEDGDELELRANGDRALFERLNLGPFTIDADNVEQFEINGLGEDDTLTVQDLSGTDVSEVVFNGGDGNDISVFSGLRADYEISLGQDVGSAEVSSSTITSGLINVEVIRFDDGDYNTANGEFTPSEGASLEIDDDEVPVYRFLRTDTQTQFYTTSEVERDTVIDTLPQYEYEEVSFVGIAPPEEGEDITGASPVYRFFNQDTGIHLYTADENEKAFVEDNLDNYVLEDTPYYGYDSQEEGTVPLYRFYNQSLDAHYYTPSAEQRDAWIESPDYQPEGGDEGIAFYVEPGSEL